MLGYTFIGYLANNVLPARLGELVRAHALGEGEHISRVTVLGTIVVERIVDTVIVVALAAIAVVILGVGGAMSTAVVLGAGFVGLLVLGLAVATVSHRLPGAARITAIAERYPRAVELARRLRDGLAVAREPGVLVRALLFSAAAWTASIATFVAGAQAVGVDLSVPQAALMCSGVALATIVPSAPGYVGTFELTAVSIATIFGTDPDAAFAMALLVHADDPGRHLDRWRDRGAAPRRGARYGERRRGGRRTRPPPRMRLVPAGRRRRRRPSEPRLASGRGRCARRRQPEAERRSGRLDWRRRGVVGLELEGRPGTAGHAQELQGVALVHLAEHRDRLDVRDPPGRRSRLGRLVHRQNDRHDRSLAAGPLK